nr:phosphoprotein [Cytorhabdovirus sp. 'lycii']
MNIHTDIVGKGLKNKPNSFFNNNSLPLFVFDPQTTPSDKLPIVKAYSGLSRNQRRKNKNWAFDPNLTRIRMENAQAMFAAKLAEGELIEKESYLNYVFDSLQKDEVPSSQTDWEIPRNLPIKKFSSPATADAKTGTSSCENPTKRWADSLEEDLVDEALIEAKRVDEEQFDKALESAAKEVVEEAMKPNEHTFRPPGFRSAKPKKAMSLPASKRGLKPSYGRRHVSHSPTSARSSRSSEECMDYGEVISMITHMFNAENVGLNRVFEDDLVRIYNEKGHLSEEAVYYYICGIKKERRNSLTNRQEALVTQMANTTAAFGKQLEIMKRQNEAFAGKMDRMREPTEVIKRREIDLKHLSSAPTQSLSRTINPVPITRAPPAKETAYRPKEKGISINEPVVSTQPKEISNVNKETTGDRPKQDAKDKDPVVPDPLSHRQQLMDEQDINNVTEIEKMENLMSALQNVSFPFESMSSKQLLQLMEVIENKSLVKMMLTDNDADRMGYMGMLTDIVVAMKI